MPCVSGNMFVCLRKFVCVLNLCADHRRVGGAGGALLMNVVCLCLREYVCVLEEICVCVVFVCAPSRSCRNTR